MTSELIIRELHITDCQNISESFQKQGWNKPISQYLKYLEHQDSGKRDIIVAEWNQAIAGYLTIKWKSEYKFFQQKKIPEIVDFNVFKKFQRQGIGTKLMDEAELRIKKVSDYAGIGFGVTRDYGAAQILYIKRNYIPDGNGLIKNSMPLSHGMEVTIDDDIVFYLAKKL